MSRIGQSNKNLFLGIIIIVIIGIAAFSATQPVQVEWIETGEETGTTYLVTIMAYKDGEPVGESIIMAGYESGGIEIDSFLVNVTWSAGGTSNIDWSTFVLSGSFRVDFVNEYDHWVKEYETTISSFESSGTWTKTLVLGTDICKMVNIIGDSWYLQFTGSITGSVSDVVGTPLSETITLPKGTVMVSYVTVFTFTGGWEY